MKDGNRPRKFHSLKSRGTVLNALLFFAHSAFFIRFSHLFHLSLSYLYYFYSVSLSLILSPTQAHTYSLCDEFDMIFHSGRRLSLMWSWAPEFPSNEFFYYASPLHPLQGYSLTAMWSCVNTKLPRVSISVSLCVRVLEREGVFATGLHATVKQII